MASLIPTSGRRGSFTPPLKDALPNPQEPDLLTFPDLWRSRAKFAWDSSHLLVLIESIGPAPKSDFTKHEDLLHQADVLELFLDADGRGRRILELQVSPRNVTAAYVHHWNQPATYPADRIDISFYRSNHHADRGWAGLPHLQTSSTVEALRDGQTRWTVMMAVPMAEPLAAAGMPTTLREGQKLYVNVLRYAYRDNGGRRAFRQYNLVPVRHGCPHQTPMAVMELITGR